jgi:hypothetical protein
MCDKCEEHLLKYKEHKRAPQISDLKRVGFYEETQHYGGPEEGGWYYWTRRYLGKSVELECWAEACEMRDAINDENTEELLWKNLPADDRDFWSGLKVARGQRVFLERTPGDADNSNNPRPFYE